MFDESELRRMTPPERLALARALAALDDPVPSADARTQRRRRLIVVAALGGAVVLAGWIGFLAATLPRYYQAGGWRVTWVGFDVGLFVIFALTAWAAWRRRQVLIGCLIVMATLLTCDAWFDTTLDWRTSGFPLSVVMALLVELPLATVALIGARRLLRLTIGRLEALEGSPGPVPPFWQVPLFGEGSIGYRAVFRRNGAQRPG